MINHPTEQQFLQDVANHQMDIIRDDGVYRHIRFKKPGTGILWFEIVTWPWRLIYTGDMGTFVFSRLEDMFEFFRTDRNINPGYWSEKLLACERNTDNGRAYDAEAFKAEVITCLENYEPEPGLRSAVIKEIEDIEFNEGEHFAMEAVSSIRVELPGRRKVFRFEDPWEINSRSYTYRFIWCCYALKWAIAKYDEYKQEVKE